MPVKKLTADDRPPYPEKPLTRLVSILSDCKLTHRNAASVRILLQIDDCGVVRFVEAIESDDKELLAAVRKTVYSTKFFPALCAGESCSIEFPLILELEGSLGTDPAGLPQ